MDDERLEQIMRDGLAEWADEAQARPGLADTARASARRRRALKVGAAGVAVVAVVVPLAFLVSGGDQADRRTTANRNSDPAAPPSTSAGTPVGQIPESWRVESYRGIQVQVPPDWGWGAAPTDDIGGGTSGESFICGDGAYSWPGKGDADVVHADRPYVGRSGYATSDLCINVQPPTYPKVWLGTPYDVGVVDPGNGFVQETVDVEGVRVTAVDDEPERLAMILASAEPVSTDANGCDAVGVLTEVPPAVEGFDPTAVQRLSVCAYRVHDPDRDGPVGRYLGYSTARNGAAAQMAADAVFNTPASPSDCQPGGAGYEWVVLRFDDGSRTQDVFSDVGAECAPGYHYGGTFRGFSRANVEPWAVDGISTYVSGGMTGNAVSGFFHPVWG